MMGQAPGWTEQEFELLLSNPVLTDEAVADQLPQHTVEAVEVVRNAIHSHHTGELYESILSKMMHQRLTQEPRLICPRCGERIGY